MGFSIKCKWVSRVVNLIVVKVVNHKIKGQPSALQ